MYLKTPRELLYPTSNTAGAKKIVLKKATGPNLLKLYTTRSEANIYSRSGCRTMEKEHYFSRNDIKNGDVI